MARKDINSLPESFSGDLCEDNHIRCLSMQKTFEQISSEVLRSSRTFLFLSLSLFSKVFPVRGTAFISGLPCLLIVVASAVWLFFRLKPLVLVNFRSSWACDDFPWRGNYGAARNTSSSLPLITTDPSHIISLRYASWVMRAWQSGQEFHGLLKPGSIETWQHMLTELLTSLLLVVSWMTDGAPIVSRNNRPL